MVTKDEIIGTLYCLDVFYRFFAKLFPLDINILDKTLERQTSRTYEPPQFKAIYCDNTKESTAEELNIDPNEVPTGTALKMCHEPSCGQICDDHCKSIGKDSYSMTEVGVGNNPFCVCGC